MCVISLSQQFLVDKGQAKLPEKNYDNIYFSNKYLLKEKNESESMSVRIYSTSCAGVVGNVWGAQYTWEIFL